MAITVTSDTLLDGTKTTVMKFTAEIGGTEDEAAVVKVDVSELAGAPTSVKIQRIWYTTDGISVKILFDATTDVLAYTVPNSYSGYIDFRSFGGVLNNAGAGVTGDISFTTIGGGAGDSYSIVMEVSKS